MTPENGKKVRVKIVRAEGKFCGREYEFDTLTKANLHLDTQSSTFPLEGYDKHDLLVELPGEDNSYKGTLLCKHPDNPHFRKTSNNVYEHMVGVLQEEIEISATDEYRKSIKELLELIKQVYKAEQDALTQTQSFSYRGLQVKRISHSVTQSSYLLSSPDGKVSFSFCCEAPYDKTSMCRVQYDGRNHEWQKTDQEIKNSIDALLSYGNTFGNGKLAESFLPYATDSAGLPIPLPEVHLIHKE